MSTYLFNWKGWDWDTLDQDVGIFKKRSFLKNNWTCGNRRNLSVGSRFFLLRLGEKPKGIMAAGFTSTEPVEGDHFTIPDKTAFYVEIKITEMLHPFQQQILPLELLQAQLPLPHNWTPQGSGIALPTDAAEKLEMLWANQLRKNGQSPTEYQEEAIGAETFYEGAPRLVYVNIYERNPDAREECLKHYDCICSVCDFDFSKTYPEIGDGYIHVHHLKLVSEIGEKYEVDPLKDLRPICPNCHAMLHKGKPQPYSIEELKRIMRRS